MTKNVYNKQKIFIEFKPRNFNKELQVTFKI